MLRKLELYGCNDKTLKWFKSYLSNRTQYVFLNNIRSDKCYVKYGVPQGSILGPLLFVIYINDLVLHCTESSAHLYADGSTLEADGKSVSDLCRLLSKDINNVENWCANNHFVVNTQKSNAMIICSNQKRKHLDIENYNLYLYGAQVLNVKEYKLLGLNIDQRLTWKSHADSICKKISGLVGLMYRIGKFLDFKSKTLFYNSYILPRIDYCLSIWGDAPSDSLSKLFRLQKRAARIVLNVNKDTPSIYMFNKLGWMSVYQRVIYQKYLIMYNIVNNICPKYLSRIICFRSEGIYNLRSSDKCTLTVPFPRKELFKKSLQYSGAHLWNILPIYIREAPNLNIFKSKCKLFILMSFTFDEKSTF